MTILHTMRMFIGLILTAILVLPGCSSEPQTPEEVLQAFFAALERQEYAKAGELAEPHTRAFLDLVGQMAEVQRVTGQVLDLPEGSVELAGSLVRSGELEVVIPVRRQGRIENIHLVQEEGRWRVKLPESFF